ncbi:MAG: UDP-N-acetylglucosamine 2-epimerase [Methanomicrobiales archaeon]|nr:UDP-N-acetylglucosamine 2-epimerase [Methanomicrobiales archaeon]
MTRRKILAVSGTRADYGLMRSVFAAIRRHQNLELVIAATGMHLMAEYGFTLTEIQEDGIPVRRVEATYQGDDRPSMARFLGAFIEGFTRLAEEIRPDIILLLGDRAEMLGGAAVGAYLAIPLAHVHGGDRSSTVDDPVRHAITKLSHLHFAATRASAERILRMGEDPTRVVVVGAPSLDALLNEEPEERSPLFRRYGLNPEEPLIMVLQHPVTMEVEQAADQMRETLRAVEEVHLPTLVLYPNADAGGRSMIRSIREFEHLPYLRVFPHLPYRDYVAFLRNAAVLVGNSSSGIIEAPVLHLPVVNVGTRQVGRERSENVLEAGYRKAEIREAIRTAVSDPGFREQVKNCRNPYGDGHAGERIAKVLSEIPLGPALVQKEMSY